MNEDPHGHIRHCGEGFVTSARASPALSGTIGIGLIERGFDHKGGDMLFHDSSQLVPARIIHLCFGEQTRA